MTIVLIIISAAVAMYIYAAVTSYYGFKKWHPLCGCNEMVCTPKRQRKLHVATSG
jgi:hypothetical protein